MLTREFTDITLHHRESRVFDGGVFGPARDLFRPLQHVINLGEVDVGRVARKDFTCRPSRNRT